MPIPYGGTTKATVSPVLKDQVDRLRSQNGSVLDGCWMTGVRQWMSGDYEGEPGSAEGVVSSYTRESIAVDYDKVVSDPEKPGTAADAVSLRLQNDVLACMERGVLLEEIRPVRASLHAAARRRGHAHPMGVLGNMVDQAAIAIRQGAVRS